MSRNTRQATPTRTYRVILTLVVALGAVLMLMPFYWLVVASTHTSNELFSNPPPLLPGGQLLENVSGLLTETDFGAAVRNSLIVSSVYTIFGTVVCTAAGYAFAKYRFPGRGIMFAIILITLALPSQVTLVPLFQIMVQLGWLSTYQALILPNLALPFGIFFMRQTMLSVPDEIIHAARVDGADEFRIFGTVVVPTITPSLAALAIFLFLAQWNDFAYPLIVQRTPDSYTIPVALASLQSVIGTDYGQLLAGTLISVLPILGLFLFLQRYFVAGLLAGAVKQ